MEAASNPEPANLRGLWAVLGVTRYKVTQYVTQYVTHFVMQRYMLALRAGR